MAHHNELPDQFILWKSVPDPMGKKPKKVPCDIFGNNINSHDPNIFMSYEQVVTLAEKHGFHVGFVLTKNDPYFLLDLDGVRNVETGIWDGWSQGIVKSMPNAASELSFSKNGLHIMGKCDARSLDNRRRKFNNGKGEFYTEGRFIAMGYGFQEHQDINLDWTKQLADLIPLRDVGGEDHGDGAVSEYTGPQDDDTLIEMMINSAGSISQQMKAVASFRQLWRCEEDVLAGFWPSEKGDDFNRSSADAALMLHLAFWTGKDKQRMIRLMRRSGLVRPKWDKHAKYLSITAVNAVKICKGVYSNKSASPNGGALSTPQPLLREVADGEPYPIAALGCLEAVVRAVQGVTQAPMAIPAQSALATASLAVQGFRNIETLGGVRPLSVYCLTVAASGERKTSCDEYFTKPITEYEMAASAKQALEVQCWNNNHAIWKSSHEAIISEVKKFTKEGKTVDQSKLNALGEEPSRPRNTDRLVSEPTFEGLTRLYTEGQPSLGLFSDEGGQFLGGHAMKSENRTKTLTSLNDLWQAHPIKRTRGGDGSITLYDRRLAVHLMAQPLVISNFMSDPITSDSGFLPRFLISYPASTIGTRFQENIKFDTAALEVFTNKLNHILSTPMPVSMETGGVEPSTLTLSETARTALSSFSDDVEAKQALSGEYYEIRGWASKAAEQAARISGVLTSFANISASQVELPEMENAITLMNYYLGEAKRRSNIAVSMETGGVEPSTLTLSETARTALSSFSDERIRNPRVGRISGVLTSFAYLPQVELPEMENEAILVKLNASPQAHQFRKLLERRKNYVSGLLILNMMKHTPLKFYNKAPMNFGIRKAWRGLLLFLSNMDGFFHLIKE